MLTRRLEMQEKKEKEERNSGKLSTIKLALKGKTTTPKEKTTKEKTNKKMKEM